MQLITTRSGLPVIAVRNQYTNNDYKESGVNGTVHIKAANNDYKESGVNGTVHIKAGNKQNSAH